MGRGVPHVISFVHLRPLGRLTAPRGRFHFKIQGIAEPRCLRVESLHMASIITKKELDHLAELARIKLTEKEEEKLLKDLPNILNYFEELKALDTTGIQAHAGGVTIKNAFREDSERESTNQKKGVKSFPEKDHDYLKIPPVFE